MFVVVYQHTDRDAARCHPVTYSSVTAAELKARDFRAKRYAKVAVAELIYPLAA